jgi:protein tyrosine phosphatase type 4A
MATTMANHNQPPTTMMTLSRKPAETAATATTGGAANNNNGGLALTLSSKPTLITTQSLRFLIMDAPRQSNLHLYIKECKRHHVTDIVRVCEPTYLGAELKTAGMTLHEMAYDDGQSPSEDVLNKWLALVQERFFSENQSSDASATIAVHCVAGLGRAPVLVAIALMEFENMDAVEAVMMIRKNRRGAINEKQLQYLEGEKCRMRKGGGGCACAIM